MKKVACVGILVADTIVAPVTSSPEKGQLVGVDSICVRNGGNAMTASLNLSTLGVESGIFGMVGKDLYGSYLAGILRDKGVDVRGLCTDECVGTSASVVMVDEKGQRSFFHTRGTNAVFTEKDISYSVIDDYDMVFVTGTFLMDRFDGQPTARFLKNCKEKGKTTFLDVCWDATDRWGLLLEDCLPYLDFFMPSIDEARCIARKDDLDEMAQVFMDKGAKNVIIKCGNKGSYMRLQNWEKGKLYPCYDMGKVVDTTGAGDSFCSGFLAATAKGWAPEQAMEFANAVGGLCCTQIGATQGIVSFEKTLDKMRELGFIQ